VQPLFVFLALLPLVVAVVLAELAQGGLDPRVLAVLGVLTAIDKQLKGMGLGLGDVVKMQVFLVGDEAHGGRMDFAGFMAGYRQFFGTREQPKLPARSAFQVAALGNPGYRVEIEVIAVRP